MSRKESYSDHLAREGGMVTSGKFRESESNKPIVERDYLERTIATVRNHRDSENCWPQWANIFADEIERLWGIEEKYVVATRALQDYAELRQKEKALRRAAGDFVTAYRAASMSDEEGLLMAIDPDAMRQLWHRVDEAATDVEQAL